MPDDPMVLGTCSRCTGAIVLGAENVPECSSCGWSTAAARGSRYGERRPQDRRDVDPNRVSEIWPAVGGRLLVGLYSGVIVAYELSETCELRPLGAAESAERASERLRVLPRTDGKWIVFDGEQPLARGDLEICRSMEEACAALLVWVEQEESVEGIPLRAPVPPPRGGMVFSAGSGWRVRDTPPASGGSSRAAREPSQPAALPKPGRGKWPGCGHRKFARDKKCRLCAKQVLVPGTEIAEAEVRAAAAEGTRSQAAERAVAEHLEKRDQTWGEWIAEQRGVLERVRARRGF
jgi:hypothetical protein